MMTDKIHHIKTHCARMDHGGCALVVSVKDNKIIEVRGDTDGFLNKGYICSKGLASPNRLNHPSRLRHPLKRVGKRGEGKWEQISWETAIQTVSERLNSIREQYGAKSVAFCQGMPKGLEHFVLIRLANIFGSPNVVTVQDVCHAPREVSGMHTCGFYPVADFHHPSRLAVLWGSNITATNEEGEICRLLLDQLKQGTELMVIDPRKTDLAEKASSWLQIRPGTDNALALAFLNVIIEGKLYDEEFVENHTYGFEELAAHVKNYTPEKMSDVTRVPANLIRESARRYAASRPAVIQWGNPIEQNINAFDTARALICLMAICGNLDIPGGNIQANEPKILGLGKFVRADLIPLKPKEMIHAHHGTIPRLMTVPPAFFRKAVLEDIPYPVRGAYMQCTNPLLAYADSRHTYDALMNLDFFAVSDIIMTPTAALADIVLPAATHFEFNDIGHYGLGHGYILARPKAVDPPEECWPDMKILNELGKSLTSPEYWYENYEDFLDTLLKPCGFTYSQFVEKGYLKGQDRFQKYTDSGFRTSTGKVELRLSRAEKFRLSPLPQFTEPPEPDDPDYPLILTSAKDRHYLHSSYRWVEKLRKHSPVPLTEIHPETAEQYGISEGDEIHIETRFGSIIQIAHLTEKVPQGVVYSAYGWWFPEGDAEAQYEWEKSNFNILTSVGRLGGEFGTPNLKGLMCRIRRR
ncbi:molybdopterin-dependent oxidoreductase [Desulfococcaceae bacterium HSG8]|nr:molybdopterin-dependent oxidoreductase [Desulfococcaceae bacterium HSG8]